jgi:glycosyltransferase involved in cell wall biosynthesis
MLRERSRMRICTFYESRLGRNDGSPLYWTNILRKMGHEVVHLSSEYPPDKFGKFDLYIWIDWGEDALTEFLPYTPIKMNDYHPSLYVASDTHLGYEYRMNKAKEFDYVFCNQADAVGMFEKDGIEALWLPHAVEPQAYPNAPVAIKKYDIGFVGYVSFQKRAEMLDKIFRAFPNFFYGQRLFEDCADIYRKSRIVFNTAATDDVNMRCFEATATGSFLLTEDVPSIHDLFEDGKHLVTYKDMDDAVEKAEYYLNNKLERENIAFAGMEHTLNMHTYLHRVDNALKIVRSNNGKYGK